MTAAPVLRFRKHFASSRKTFVAVVGNPKPRAQSTAGTTSTTPKPWLIMARQLDPTRLLTAANERHYADANTQVVDDLLGESLDVLGCNEYIGWYDGPAEKADRLTWRVALDKPLIIGEFGGDALFGLHGNKGVR
jgi:beta-glucuronidase